MSSKTFGRLWLPRFVPLLFLVMACFALPQQAAAQNSADVIISIDDARVGEGDGSVTLTARPAPPRRVTIPANTLSANFTVFIRNDTLDEPDEETLTVTLGGNSLPPETNFIFNGSHRATLTIIDNDDPPPPVNNRVSIVDPQPIMEGASHLNFVVSTGFNVNSDVVLGVAYAGGTTNPATPADDLGADRPTTVTILAGERRATLRVPIINDDIVEKNETFTVALSLPAENPPGHTLFLDANESEATGTINDNDGTANVSLRATAVAPGAEGGTITFTVDLDNPVVETFSLGWTASDGTATVNDDLDDQTGTVEIAANTTEATFTVPITDDTIVDNISDRS